MPSVGVKTRDFMIKSQALDFQDWMDRNHPECEIRAFYDRDKRMWSVQWLCNRGWYQKSSGRRV